MNTVRKTPAKVNLFLRMDGKREDGYHLLFSAMQAVSIYDTITVEVDAPENVRETSVTFTSNCGFLTDDPKKNTAVKAANLFLQALDEPYAVSIALDKQIPSQAGLGGGSSDGAAVLLALNELLPGRVTESQLLEMAVKIGADVPFFLKGGTVLCEGVGEIMTELPSLAGIPMLIMKPRWGVSTPRCYAKFDELQLPKVTEQEKQAILQSLCGEEAPVDPFERAMASAAFWSNDLQIPAMSDVPCMQEGLNLMRDAGADFVAMSGSGSAIFGIFKNERDINDLLGSRAVRSMERNGWWIRKAATV